MSSGFTQWITRPNPKPKKQEDSKWEDTKWKCEQCQTYYKQYTPPGSEDEGGAIKNPNWHQRDECDDSVWKNGTLFNRKKKKAAELEARWQTQFREESSYNNYFE